MVSTVIESPMAREDMLCPNRLIPSQADVLGFHRVFCQAVNAPLAALSNARNDTDIHSRYRASAGMWKPRSASMATDDSTCCISQISYTILRMGTNPTTTLKSSTPHAPSPYLTRGIMDNSYSRKSARTHSVQKCQPWTVAVTNMVRATQR